MATEFTNPTATPVGLWDTDTVHHVAAPLGGTVALNPSQSAQETIGTLVSAGAGAVAEVFAPKNVATPSITGTAKVGETLTGDDGEWSGTPAPTLTRQWNADGIAIEGATGATYDLAEGDEGAEITLTVTATNSAGSASETSASVGPVEAAPENIAPPSISGTAKVGETLTGDDGQWSGLPEPVLTRQWNADGNPIEGATGSTYDLVAEDEGAEITITVTATNSVGSASETSAPVGPVEAVE